MSTGAAVVVPPSSGGGGMLAGDVTGPLGANVIAPGVVTGGPGGKIAPVTITGGGAGGNIAPSTITSFNIVPGSIATGSLASDALPFNNDLTNPGFNFAQLQNPSVATLIPDNSISADAWKLTRETAGVTYQRMSNGGLGGYNSAYRGRFTKTVAAGKLMIYQPLERLITMNMSNNAGVFTIKLNMSAARRMRIGFFYYTGATPNSVVPAPVAAWNGIGVAPTLNAGFTMIGSFALNGGATIGPGQSAWEISFFMPTFGDNDILCCFVVSDEQFAAADFVDLYETSFDQGLSGRFTWKALDVADDIERVRRFIEKSYDTDTLPGTVTGNGSRNFSDPILAGGSILTIPTLPKVRVPLVGEITLYSSVTGASGNWADLTAAVDAPVNPYQPGQSGFGVQVNPQTGDAMEGHFLVNTSL